MLHLSGRTLISLKQKYGVWESKKLATTDLKSSKLAKDFLGRKA